MTTTSISVPTSDDLTGVVKEWLGRLNSALSAGDAAAVQSLFVPDCYWRDVCALSWDYGWVGGEDVGDQLTARTRDFKASEFRLSEGRPAPSVQLRSRREVVEAFFEFDTYVGTAEGVVRFPIEELPASGSDTPARAWTMLSKLKSLAGLPVPGVVSKRPAGVGYERWESTDNWADHRARRSDYADRDPEVLVVGAGHSGLVIAAHLGHLGVDTLVVDKHERAGDSWRRRYHSLALHNPTEMVELPYLPYPDSFPEFLPKDVFANWLETYAANLDITTWMSTEFLGGDYDADEQRWTVRVRRGDGEEQVLRPRHVVVCTGGTGGQPKFPDLAGLEDFAGTVVHSSEFTSAKDHRDVDALVVGVGTSAHDIAMDLVQGGARVTMLQRSPTVVVSLESANSAYSRFFDGTPLDEADLTSAANFIFPIMWEDMKHGAKAMAERDKELLEGLRAAGMKLDLGIEGTGFMYKFFQNGGGYYFDVGASQAIVDGDIKILQATDLERIEPEGARLTDGTLLPLDLIVAATGFKNQRAETERYFGRELADRVGDISRFGADGELNNAWRPTAQPGLWYIISGVSPTRSYPTALAMLIRSALDGTFPGYKATR